MHHISIRSLSKDVLIVVIMLDRKATFSQLLGNEKSFMLAFGRGA